jgi:hypothetical protein
MIAFGFLLSGKFAWDNPSLRQEFMLELNVLAGVVKTLNEGKDDKEDKDDTKPKRRR